MLQHATTDQDLHCSPTEISMEETVKVKILYFFGYKMECFYFQNNLKNLDPSYKTDLDLWDCVKKGKLVLKQTFTGLIQLFLVILEGKTHVL